jgi:hypothetical protein
MKAGRAWQDGLSLGADPQICALTFYHDTQHFAHGQLVISCRIRRLDLTLSFVCLESIPYARLAIPQDLPRQSDANTSPATLYLFGATHTIAPDGTPDGELLWV